MLAIHNHKVTGRLWNGRVRKENAVTDWHTNIPRANDIMSAARLAVAFQGGAVSCHCWDEDYLGL